MDSFSAGQSALRGRPVLLVDTGEANSSQISNQIPEHAAPDLGGGTGDFGGEMAPVLADSEQPTQAFWASSPPREPPEGIQLLARQSSHRRRRLHAAIHGTPDSDDNKSGLD